MLFLNCNNKTLDPHCFISYNCEVEQERRSDREDHAKQSEVVKIQRFLNIFRKIK